MGTKLLILIFLYQKFTHRNDVLLVGDGFPELDEGDVVLKGGGVVVGVDFLPLNLVILVRDLDQAS